ncbi:NAD(P)H-binding protein [Nonomuraea sp. NPDC046802]|uniref:NAD(P)H-binding protein n=1 Tax=Nonomuraea sp. NPDC046802 TaxID=3154919 RepID=UPI0033FB892B
MTVLVLGATGRTGRLVVDGLKARGVQVRAASRSSPVRFDWDDPGTWGPVTKGVVAVYMVTPEDPGFRAELVGSFLERADGVRRIALLSGLSAGYGSVPMASREVPVRRSGVEWTILRPGAFQQNFVVPPQSGELRLPLGPQPRTAPVDVADIADVAVGVLTTEGHAGRIYGLSGPRALSYSEILEIVSRQSGRPAVYVDEPVERWLERMRADGVSKKALSWSLETFDAIRRGEYARLHDGVQQVLGRRPRDFADLVSSG